MATSEVVIVVSHPSLMHRDPLNRGGHVMPSCLAATTPEVVDRWAFKVTAAERGIATPREEQR